MQPLTAQQPISVDPKTGEYVWTDQLAPQINLSTGKYISNGDPIIPVVDTQALQIEASRNVQAKYQSRGLPPSTVPQVSNRPHLDPLKVVVNFYWNATKKQEYISGPYSPGEGHLQRPADRPATDRDRQLFAPQYAAYRNQRDQCRVGTLLDKLYPQNQQKVQKLYKAGIYNIEQLAELNPNTIDRHPDITHDDRIAALRYLEYINQRKELDARDQTIMVQAERIQRLEERLKQLAEKPKRERIKV